MFISKITATFRLSEVKKQRQSLPKLLSYNFWLRNRTSSDNLKSACSVLIPIHRYTQQLLCKSCIHNHTKLTVTSKLRPKTHQQKCFPIKKSQKNFTPVLRASGIAHLNAPHTRSNNKLDTLFVRAGPHTSDKLRSQNLHASTSQRVIKDTSSPCVTCK